MIDTILNGAAIFGAISVEPFLRRPVINLEEGANSISKSVAIYSLTSASYWKNQLIRICDYPSPISRLRQSYQYFVLEESACLCFQKPVPFIHNFIA